jgi:hypothetical protein
MIWILGFSHTRSVSVLRYCRLLEGGSYRLVNLNNDASRDQENKLVQKYLHLKSVMIGVGMLVNPSALSLNM